MKKLLSIILLLSCLFSFALGESLVLNTTTIDGETVTNDLIAGSSVVLVNFWEPWCSPCVNEMPDLQRLYEQYKDRGLTVIGIFSSTDYISDARSLIKEMGLGYPILIWTYDMIVFETGYVPTTILVDGSGRVLTKEPVIGSHSFEYWEQLILEYLK